MRQRVPGGGTAYDDTELRGLIAGLTSALAAFDGRLVAGINTLSALALWTAAIADDDGSLGGMDMFLFDGTSDFEDEPTGLTWNAGNNQWTNTSGLVNHWGMQEADGATVDDDAGSNDGTATGTTIVDGAWGKRRRFDGTDDVISCGDIPALASDFSIAMRVKFSDYSAAGYYILACKDNPLGSREWSLDVQPSTGDIWFYGFYDATYYLFKAADMPFDASEHLITFTLSGGTGTFYLDGNAQVTTLESGTVQALNNTSEPLRIGARSGNQYVLAGDMADMRIYNRALSAGEITTIASATSAEATTYVDVSATILATTVAAPPTHIGLRIPAEVEDGIENAVFTASRDGETWSPMVMEMSGGIGDIESAVGWADVSEQPEGNQVLINMTVEGKAVEISTGYVRMYR